MSKITQNWKISKKKSYNLQVTLEKCEKTLYVTLDVLKFIIKVYNINTRISKP